MKFNFKENQVSVNLNYGELNISGDAQHGFRPFQLLVSAVASCSGSVFRKILKKQRIEIESLAIEAEVERNAEEANRIEKIFLTFLIKGDQLDKDRLTKSLATANKNCAMVQSIKGSIEVVENIKII